MMWLLLAACVSGGAGDKAPDSGTETGPTPDVPVLSGARGSEGVLLWSGAAAVGWVLQADDGTGDGWVDLHDDDAPWFDPGAPAGRSYRLQDPRTETTTPAIISEVSATLSAERALLLGGEAATLTLEATAVNELSPGLMGSDGRWLDAACFNKAGTPDGCWRDDFVTMPNRTTLRWSASTDTPQVHALTLALAGLDGRGERVVVAAARLTIAELGRSIAWGDPHAHSNLSQDGCEDHDDLCRSRGETAAADFFAQALDRGLDFAALTDHAEYSQLYPEGTEDEVVIWQAQQQLALEADDGTFLPLVGYEWTNFNGHRTVIFEQAEVCAALRVSGKASPDEVIRMGEGDRLVPDNAVQALTPAGLWTALDEGAESCATQRILSIPHHTAMRLPEPVVWSDPLNTPDLYYERLVEVTSEHGTSECADLEDEHCDYRIKTVGGYLPTGSIQSMLQLGYALGFVGGTDSHDSRPGSTNDGPSCVSLSGDVEAPCHEYPGGLTGVMYAGTLDRGTLFDGLFARNTVAASALPINARAMLTDGDSLHLPGDDVPAGDYTLHASVPETGVSVLSIEAINQDGERLALLSPPADSAALSLGVGESVYLRVRLDASGVEERLWLSPFFGF